MSNFLDTKDKAFWRALLGVVSLGMSIGLAALILHELLSNFLDTKDKAFWRALLGVVSLGVSIGLAALILRL